MPHKVTLRYSISEQNQFYILKNSSLTQLYAAALMAEQTVRLLSMPFVSLAGTPAASHAEVLLFSFVRNSKADSGADVPLFRCHVSLDTQTLASMDARVDGEKGWQRLGRAIAIAIYSRPRVSMNVNTDTPEYKSNSRTSVQIYTDSIHAYGRSAHTHTRTHAHTHTQEPAYKYTRTAYIPTEYQHTRTHVHTRTSITLQCARTA